MVLKTISAVGMELFILGGLIFLKIKSQKK